jgi:hypothetical protein
VTSFTSIDSSILRLWYGRDDERLSLNQLLTRKNSKRSDRKLQKLSERQFLRHLKNLTSKMQFLDKYVDKSRNTWYFKTEKGKRKSFASILEEWIEREAISENRDAFGSSTVYSDPPLSNFFKGDEFEELYDIMDDANEKIVSKISEKLIAKKLGDLSDRERANIVFYRENINAFNEMKRRFEKSDVVKTRKEERVVNSKVLNQAKLIGFESIEEFKSKAGDRFHRMFRNLPLTFSEEKEYQNLKNRFSSVSLRLCERLLAKIEDEVPRLFCCFYNFEMEELLLSQNDLVLTVNGDVRLIEEVLGSLRPDELSDYIEKLQKALQSPIARLPRWVGSSTELQPQMRASWDNSTRRTYLHHLLLFAETKSASNRSTQKGADYIQRTL